MPRIGEASCETCRFFRAGHCYLNPPIVLPHSEKSIRPRVEPEDFCLSHMHGRAPWNPEFTESEPDSA